MQISNNNSLAFGSIQVNLTKMTPGQRRVSDRLFNSLKYSEKYSKLTADKRAGEDLDIYMLPKSGHRNGINILFMDPYSGDYVRDNNDKIIKEELFSTVCEQVEKITDNIVDTYEKIVKGVFARPKEDVSKFIKGETEMHMINPEKSKDLSESVRDFRRLGYPKTDAEEQAFEQYKNLYHIDNKDADF